MPVRPRHTLGENRPVAQRQFTDRDDFQELIHRAVRSPGRQLPNVIVCYGVGGVGKTSLRRKLCETLDSDPGAAYSVVDFDIPAHRSQEMALSVLRREFRRRYRAPFNTFDIAYAVYWQKAKPNVALQKESFPLWEEGAIVADLVGLLGDVPAVGWIPKLAKMAGRGSRLVEEWWTKRGNEELRGLHGQDAVQIAERLPMFWAADVRDYLATREVRGVVFLDTYEALTEGERSEGRLLQHDAWVRELVAQLPEVLWVICGRERLRWGEIDKEWEVHLDQHLVGNLAVPDSEQFLVSCGIDDPAIRAAIVAGSQGLPYYLDLAVDTYQQIVEAAQRPPVPSDFARTSTDVFARFLRHLTQPEIETLKVLSIPRFWNRGLFELLVKEFRTDYPMTAFNDLCRFSFISEDAARGTWSMHQLMRESLKDHLDKELKQRIHKVLFGHYADQVKDVGVREVGPEHGARLSEAFHHAQSAVGAEELFTWFNQAASAFRQAAQWTVLLPLYRNALTLLQQELGPNHVLVSQVLTEIGVSLHEQGKYADAEPVYRRALATSEAALGPTHPDVATDLSNLAALLCAQARYAEAEALQRRALAILEAQLGSDRAEVANSLNELATALHYQGKYADAEPAYRRALSIHERILGPDHPDTATDLNNLAVLLFDRGLPADAEPLHRRALAIREARLGPTHSYVAFSLDNLAALLRGLGKYSEAEVLHRRALTIREEQLGPDHPYVATSLNNLAALLCDRDELTEAEALHRRALAIRETALGPDHPVVAHSLCNLATLLCKRGQYAEAESLLRRALTIREAKLGPIHPDVAKSLDSLAELYGKTGRVELATECTARAEAIRATRQP